MSIQFCFPGWTRKSLTFTIDDGNVPLDLKFMAITKPAGFRGTFNLMTPLRKEYSAEDYRRFYFGYEIANHCRLHAYPCTPELEREDRDELFDPETADRRFRYRESEPGLYRIYTYNWTYQAEDDKFIEMVDSCNRDLESIFGTGKVRSFVWPCGKQNNPAVFERLKEHGFQSIRNAACTLDNKNNFSYPVDRMSWSYNADYTNLLEVGRQYEALSDDGALKFFCFGVHSHDFENHGKWPVLEQFAAEFGCRPEKYYYATVGELFDYEDAVKAVRREGCMLVNDSALDIYLEMNGKRAVLRAFSSLKDEA